MPAMDAVGHARSHCGEIVRGGRRGLFAPNAELDCTEMVVAGTYGARQKDTSIHLRNQKAMRALGSGATGSRSSVQGMAWHAWGIDAIARKGPPINPPRG